MPKVQLKNKGNTTVYRDLHNINVVLYNTTVVRYDPVKDKLTLNSGGWLTVTTKQRMNQFMDEYNLPLNVYQEDFEWYVYNRESGETVTFTDNMEINLDRRGGSQ